MVDARYHRDLSDRQSSLPMALRVFPHRHRETGRDAIEEPFRLLVVGQRPGESIIVKMQQLIQPKGILRLKRQAPLAQIAGLTMCQPSGRQRARRKRKAMQVEGNTRGELILRLVMSKERPRARQACGFRFRKRINH